MKTYTKQTIYRDQNGKFISEQRYNNYQRNIQRKQQRKFDENIECLKITAKIMIVIVLGVSIFTIINNLSSL